MMGMSIISLREDHGKTSLAILEIQTKTTPNEHKPCWPELQVTQLSCKRCGILQRNWVCASASHCRITNHPQTRKLQTTTITPFTQESATCERFQQHCSLLHPWCLLEHPAPVCWTSWLLLWAAGLGERPQGRVARFQEQESRENQGAPYHFSDVM